MIPEKLLRKGRTIRLSIQAVREADAVVWERWPSKALPLHERWERGWQAFEAGVDELERRFDEYPELHAFARIPKRRRRSTGETRRDALRRWLAFHAGVSRRPGEVSE